PTIKVSNSSILHRKISQSLCYMALHGLRSLLGLLPNRFQITELGIGNRELVSFPAFLKHFSRRLWMRTPAHLLVSPSLHLAFVSAGSGLKKEPLL
ncbi:MAG TPA: hypothetical protein VLA84_17830, partial [Microcoleus sp.]|nr:hypothetical protein [Microcoleus sp.]